MFFPIIWVLRVVIWWPLLYCWVVRRTPRFIFTLSVRFQRKRRTVLVRHNAFGRSPSSLDLLLSCYWSSKGRVRRSDVSRLPLLLQQLSLSVRPLWCDVDVIIAICAWCSIAITDSTTHFLSNGCWQIWYKVKRGTVHSFEALFGW